MRTDAPPLLQRLPRIGTQCTDLRTAAPTRYRPAPGRYRLSRAATAGDGGTCRYH